MITDETKITEYYVDLFVKNPVTSTSRPGADETARWTKIETFLKRIAAEAAAAQSARMLRILDVGCGRGWLTNLASAYGEAEGVEPVAEVLEHAGRLFPHLAFYVGTPETVLKRPDFVPYDVVLCSEVIEHVPHHEQSAFVASLVRLLRPGGHVILTTPRAEAFDEFKRFYTPDQPIEDWLSEQQIAILFARHGFHALGNDRIYLTTPDLSYVLEPTPRDHQVRNLISVYQVWVFQSGEKQAPNSKADPLSDALESEGRTGCVSLQASRCVLIACTHFPPSIGGLETVAAQLGRSLIAKGYEVHVATERSEKREFTDYCGITIHPLDPVSVPGQRLPQAALQLRELIVSSRYDACILLADPRNWIFWSLEGLEVPEQTRIIAQPLINAEGFARWRDNRAFRTRLTQILKRVHSVIAISTCGAIVEYLTEEGIPFVYIPNAVEREEACDGFRARYGIPESVPMFVHIANLWPVKNHLGLMDALSTMDGDWRLVMIGHSSGDSQYDRQVHEAVRRDPRFMLIPGLPRHEIAAALNAADLLLLASHGEVAPVTVLEAMSHATPWLATPQCGGVHDNAGGLIIPIEEFHRVLSWLLKNPHVLQRLGRLGYEHWSECFRWETVVEAWDSLIKGGASSFTFAIPTRINEEVQRIRAEIPQTIRGDSTPTASTSESHCPLVSVIVPTFNRPDTLIDALRSILNQTYRDFEIIVVNDGGSDIENVVRFLDKDGRITYIRHGNNRDRAAARNTAIKVARGRYIAYLDDDDLYYPDHLEALVTFLQQSGQQVAYTDAHRAHQEKRDGRYVVTKRDIPYSFDFDYDRILVHNFVPVLCVMHERACLDAVGLFDESLTTHEDWELWIRMSRRFQFAHIKKVTCEFAWKTDGSTTTSSKLPDFRRTMAIIFERHQASDVKKPHIRRAQEQVLRALSAKIAGSNIAAQPARPQQIVTLLQQADSHTSRGEYAAAREAVSRVVALEPDDPALLVTLGNLNLQLGDVEAARHEFLKATVLHPGYAPAHADLAAVLLHLGRAAEAEASIRQALALEPTNPDALKVLARVCLDSERYAEAVQAYVTVLRVNPDDVETLLLVGNCYAEAGRPEDAKTFYQRVLTLDPGNAVAAENLAVVNGKGPPLDRAISVGSEASKREPVQLSIIIPVFNCLDLTRQCLESIRRNSPVGRYEIVVVDNGSTDGTTEFLCQQPSGDLRAILNAENIGFARACNQGARAASGPYLLFLNNDTEVRPGWLEPLVAVLDADPAVAAVGSKLLFPDGTIQHAGVIIVNDQKRPQGLSPCHIYYRHPADLPGANQPRTYQALTAASLLVRRSAYIAVGGFDENYWNGFEDVDFCFKLQNLGWRLVYEPKSVVIHYESQSGPERFRQESRNVERLRQEWSGKVMPDFVIKPDGTCVQTDVRRVMPYSPSAPSSLGRSETPTPCDPPIVSIVIVTYNSARTIRACLESVFSATRTPIELIVVDNASTDTTSAVLAEYQDRIIALLNTENAGFSRGCNQGIRVSTGEYVVLLNPDTVVTSGWLERLLAHMRPGVGAVGPVSDYVAGLQKCQLYLPGDEPTTLTLHEVAHLLGTLNRRKAVETRLLIGFCLLASRKVLDDVGLLDEDLFLGNDDLDLSWRLRLRGYQLLIATDALVHHEGQVSFKSEAQTKTSRLVQESTDRLYAKLEAHYGVGNVPSPMELWGIDWFRPTKKSEGRSPKCPSRLTSIIILTHNGIEHTKKCLASIDAHTPEPYELIIVDNGSSDGTLDYLRDYMAVHDNARVVANRSNHGFAAGNNQGLALAQGAYALLLNNDTVVTEGWLKRMLQVFEAHPDTGIVGPMSNYVSGPQLVRDASYGDLKGLEAFAAEWARDHDGQSGEATRVVGFCLLMRKEVIARIGGLDERFGSGNFEDDDLCIRAFQVGFRARIALDVFIHHTGSQTFKAAGIDYRHSLMRNWELFKAKWSIAADSPYEKGYHFPPQGVSDSALCLPLPDVSTDHRCEVNGRWWQEIGEDRNRRERAVTEETRFSAVIISNGHGLAPLWSSLVQHTNYPLAITIVSSTGNGNGCVPPRESPRPEDWQITTADMPHIPLLNELLRSADNGPIILLSSELILTPGWLKRLLAAFDRDPRIAVVGPTLNHGPGPQQVKADYSGTGKALRQFGVRRARRYGQQLAVTERLSPSCIVFNPAVCRTIGPLREDLDLAASLADYFARIKQAGHALVVALGAYVHCG